MVHSKGSSGEAVYEPPEPANDVVGAAIDVVVGGSVEDGFSCGWPRSSMVVVVAESAGIGIEVSCSATDDVVGGVVEVTAGGVVSVSRSVASSREGRDVVAWVSLTDESVEPQDCKASIETSVMVSKPARCLAIASAYLLNARGLSRRACEVQVGLREQEMNNELEPHIRLAVAL